MSSVAKMNVLWWLHLCFALTVSSLHLVAGVVDNKASTFVDSACSRDADCAYRGKCMPDSRRCNCYGDNCPQYLTAGCPRLEKYPDRRYLCMKEAREDYMRPNRSIVCHEQHDLCVCPADDMNKCHVSDLKVYPVLEDDSYIEGQRVTLKCCINMDQRGLIKKVWMVHNGTIEIDATQNATLLAPNEYKWKHAYTRCWTLHYGHVHDRDTGYYSCRASLLPPYNTAPYIESDSRVFIRVKRKSPPQPSSNDMMDEGRFADLLPSELQARLTRPVTPDPNIGESSVKHYPRYPHRHSQSSTPPSSQPPGAFSPAFSTNPERDLPPVYVRPTRQLYLQRDDAQSQQREKTVVKFRSCAAIDSRTVNCSWTFVPDQPNDLPVEIKVMKSIDLTLMKRYNNVLSRHITISDLNAYTRYTINVYYKDPGQHQKSSDVVRVQTLEAPPGPPVPVYMRFTDQIVLQQCIVVWTAPKHPNGKLIRYEVEFEGVVRQTQNSSDVLPPHRPRSLTPACAQLDDISPTSDDFFSCQFDGLWPNREYQASVWAVNSMGRSTRARFDGFCKTDFGPPQPIEVPAVRVLAASEYNGSTPRLGVQFSAYPNQTNGTISCFYLAVLPIPWNVTLTALPVPDVIDFTQPNNVFRNNLDTENRNSHWFAYISESWSRLPQFAVVGDEVAHTNSPACNVYFQGRSKAADPPLKDGVKYTGFLIIRVDPDPDLEREPAGGSFLTTRRYYADNRESSYLFDEPLDMRRDTAEQQLVRNPKYGYSGYFAPVQIGVPVSQGGDAMAVLSILLVIASVLLFLVLCALITWLLYKRGWLKQWLTCLEKDKIPDRKQFQELHKHNNRDFQPIAAEDIAAEYLTRHRDSDFLFSMEFDNLPHYANFDTTASERKENAKKNRYNDIKAFDVTRVKLSVVDGQPFSDYINANYINGYKGRKKFIAAQGPLNETLVDYWRMIWEQQVQIIVMVTNLQERHRSQCCKYWPDDDTGVQYGQVHVRMTEAVHYADYAVRRLAVSSSAPVVQSPAVSQSSTSMATTSAVGETEMPMLLSAAAAAQQDTSIYDTVASLSGSVHAGQNELSTATSTSTTMAADRGGRVVLQYHYTGWGDYRAPESTTGLIRFLMRLRAMPEYSTSPVLVHCSAGVGRTGTIIAIDGGIDQCQEEGKVDVFGFVSNLRRQRNYMVQSLEQYVFVYKALAEWFTFGETDIEMERIHAHVKQLHEPVPDPDIHINPASARSHFSPRGANSKANPQRRAISYEYKRLEKSLEGTSSCEFAKKTMNQPKNRYQGCVPYDRNRVILRPIIGHVDASYINATVVKGYFYPYILAQDPVNGDGAYALWRMVHEEKAACLVMLSDEDEFAPDETYWPAAVGETRHFGVNPSISVKLTAEDDNPVYLVRKMTYTVTQQTSFATTSSASSRDRTLDQHDVVQFVYRDWNSPPSTTIANGSKSSSHAALQQHAISADERLACTGSWPTATEQPTCSTSTSTECSANTPSTTGTLLELIGRVLQRQSYLADAVPIIVHCRDGSCRSGLYCCISLLLERLKTENRVDVFQTCKSLQAQRMGTIASLEQYEFAYQAVLDYLESFR